MEELGFCSSKEPSQFDVAQRILIIMSRNGVLALQKIIVSYNPASGDTGMRQFLATHLPLFKAKYPSVVIDIRPRVWAEKGITGIYRDGSERAFNVHMLSSMAIWIRFHKLVNQANDYDVPFNSNHVYFNRKSVQGTWNPWLWHAEARHKERVEPKKWDRKLSEAEWDYHVDRYSTQLKLREEAVASRVAAETSLSKEHTEEVAKRWKEHVAPKLQTDMEANLTKMKADFRRTGAKPANVTMGEYSLFSSPSMQELGQDAVDALRRKELEHLELWWRRRKDQLKPPS